MPGKRFLFSFLVFVQSIRHKTWPHITLFANRRSSVRQLTFPRIFEGSSSASRRAVSNFIPLAYNSAWVGDVIGKRRPVHAPLTMRKKKHEFLRVEFSARVDEPLATKCATLSQTVLYRKSLVQIHLSSSFINFMFFLLQSINSSFINSSEHVDNRVAHWWWFLLKVLYVCNS